MEGAPGNVTSLSSCSMPRVQKLTVLVYATTARSPYVYRNFTFCTQCMRDNNMHGSGMMASTILYHVF